MCGVQGGMTGVTWVTLLSEPISNIKPWAAGVVHATQASGPVCLGQPTSKDLSQSFLAPGAVARSVSILSVPPVVEKWRCVWVSFSSFLGSTEKHSLCQWLSTWEASGPSGHPVLWGQWCECVLRIRSRCSVLSDTPCGVSVCYLFHICRHCPLSPPLWKGTLSLLCQGVCRLIPLVFFSFAESLVLSSLPASLSSCLSCSSSCFLFALHSVTFCEGSVLGGSPD